MGWLFIDDFLGYLVMAAFRIFEYTKSSKWDRSTARFTGKIVKNPDLGCASVQFFYRYEVGGKAIKGSCEKPFLFSRHAREYAECFYHNVRATIRVNPANPQETHFFEWDQRGDVSA